MQLIRDTKPNIDSILTLDEAKQQVEELGPDNDENILAKTEGAIEHVVKTTKHDLSPTDYTYLFNSFPNAIYFELPQYPVNSITSIEYYDVDNVLQTLDPAKYSLGNEKPQRVTLAFGESWPTVRDWPDSVIVKFNSGYLTAGDIPKDIKEAIKILLASLYRDRETQAMGVSLSDVSFSAGALLSSYDLRPIYRD